MSGSRKSMPDDLRRLLANVFQHHQLPLARVLQVAGFLRPQAQFPTRKTRSRILPWPFRGSVRCALASFHPVRGMPGSQFRATTKRLPVPTGLPPKSRHHAPMNAAHADVSASASSLVSSRYSRPPAPNHHFLEIRLSYRIQELAYGGLRARRRVKQLEATGQAVRRSTNITGRRIRYDAMPIAEHPAAPTLAGRRAPGSPC